MAAATHPSIPPAVPALAGKAIVLFDGECPLCRRSVAILKKLDWLGRIESRDARDLTALPACAEPLTPAKLLEQMHLVTPDRQRAYAGFRAFRWMAWRLPLTMLAAPLLYLPGVPWLGQRLYRWVARNRFGLVHCSGGVCQVPPRP